MPKQTFFNLPEEKRRLILDLAIEEFAERDYNSASISVIVARAGIAKGSLYQYFEDKRDLYFYLIQLAGEEKKAFLAGHPPPDPNMDVFAYIRWLMQMGARFELSNPKMAQVAYRALFSDRPFGDEPFAQLRQAALDYYRYIVHLGIQQGVIDPEIDVDLAIFIFSTIFNEFGRYLLNRLGVDLLDLASGKVHYQELPIDDLVVDLLDIIRRGLAPRTQPMEQP
jgi:TetR/AcrR family transcriptional regulator